MTKRRKKLGDDPDNTRKNWNKDESLIPYDPMPPANGFKNTNERSSGKPGILTKRNLLMIDYYFGECNFSKYKAYKAAGYSQRGGLGMTAAVEIFNKSVVVREVERRFEIMRENAGMTPRQVMSVLEDMIQADIGELFDDNGTMKPLNKMTDRQRKMIASLKVTKYGEKGWLNHVKQYDKLKAIDMWLRVNGLYVEKPDDTKDKGDLVINIQINN